MSSVICHDLTALKPNVSSRKLSQFSGPARLKGGKSSGQNVEHHERNPEQLHTGSRHLKHGQNTRPQQGKPNLTSRLAPRWGHHEPLRDFLFNIIHVCFNPVTSH